MRKGLLASILLSAACGIVVIGCSSESDPDIGPLAFTPDSKSVVFSYSRRNSSHLFIASLADGRASRLIRSDCGEERAAAFSPTGDPIAFTCSGHIFLAKSDGSMAHRLTQLDGNEAMPRFSPDGKRLYFAKYGYFGSYSPIAQPYAHEWDVFACDLDGKSVRQLTHENFYMISELSVAPDGGEIMVSTADDKTLVYPTSGETPGRAKTSVRPASPQGHVASDSQYMPDRKSILFMAASDGYDGYDYDVYRMNLQTGAREKLTTHNGYATDLRVSPDGSLAVFLKWSKSFLRSIPERPVPYILDLEKRTLRKLDLSLAE